MLTIRLFRVGKKNQPSFKIVVTDKKNPPKSGRFTEEVGFYNSRTKEKGFKIERIKYWLGIGAQPSPTIHNLFIKEKIIDAKKIPSQRKSKKPAGDEAKASSSPSPASSGSAIDKASEKK